MNQPRKRQYEVEVESKLCKECEYCREVCPEAVFEKPGAVNTSGYRYMVPAHAEKCNGCLKCFMICPDFAITVEEEADNSSE